MYCRFTEYCVSWYLLQRGKEWLNYRVNFSLIFNHTASLFASSATNLTTSTTGLFQFRSLPQSNVILLMRAAMVGVRPNISTATAQDIRIVRCLIVRLININSLIRLNSLETNPNGLRFFWSPGFYITEHLVHVEDIILDEPLAHFRMTHSEFRIFWWEDFI